MDRAMLYDVHHRSGLNSQQSSEDNHLNEHVGDSGEAEEETVEDSDIETLLNWKTLSYDFLPEWMQDNQFLLEGHRPPLPSFAACLKSIFSVHSETGNIWTHLIGCLAFTAVTIWYLTRPSTEVDWQQKIIFSIFFVSVITCLGMSFAYHTVACHSVGVGEFFRKLDHVGISVLIVGSFVPWLFYGFYCRRMVQLIYIAMISGIGILAVTLIVCDQFAGSQFQPLRTVGIFTVMGLSAVVPAIHFTIINGLQTLIDDGALYWLLLMAFLYLGGAALYALRVPERFFPGRCDLLGQSHQLFHLCVVAAVTAHYYAISVVTVNHIHHDAACSV